MLQNRSCRNVAVGFVMGTLGAALTGPVQGQPELKLGVVYQCTGDARLRVFSCAGPNPTDACEAELRLPGQPAQRGPITRQQLGVLLASCGTGDGAAGNPPDAAANEPDRNGFKIGDEVRAATAGGWYQAKIVQRNGDSYRVRFNASTEAWKTYPAELRRSGPLNDVDRARGLFDMKERVQVNVEGKWVDGVVVGEMGMDYNVEIPGNRTVWASGQQMRRLAVAEPVAAKPGTPPRAGLKQCADKFNGRWSPTGGGGGPTFQLTFRSGKASLQEISGTTELECWSDGERLYLHKVGETAEQDIPIEINQDGTLDTPFGEVKRKGK
jgi:hypothetical protein